MSDEVKLPDPESQVNVPDTKEAAANRRDAGRGQQRQFDQPAQGERPFTSGDQIEVKILPAGNFGDLQPVFQPKNLEAGIRMMPVSNTLAMQTVSKAEWDKAEEAPDYVWNQVHLSGLKRKPKEE